MKNLAGKPVQICGKCVHLYEDGEGYEYPHLAWPACDEVEDIDDVMSMEHPTCAQFEEKSTQGNK